MEEDPSTEGYLHEEITRQYYQRELRSLELIAYAELMSAVRASGALDEGKRNIINFVREAFCITDERHKAEIRRVASDERLGLIADMINGKNTSQEWTHEGYTPFPTLPHIVKYITDEPPDTLEDGCEKENEYMDETEIDGSELPPGLLDGWADDKGRICYSETPKADDFTELSIKSESESDSPSEDEIPPFRVVKRRGPIKRQVTSTKIKIEVPTLDRGNPSPDITDAPKSAVKREINRTTAKRGRGAKRNITIGHRMPATSVPAKHNIQKSFQNSTRGKFVKNQNVSNPRPRSRSSSNDITDIPIKKTKPSDDEHSNNSVVVVDGRVGRGRGLGRIQSGRGLGNSGRGGRGRGRGGNIGKRNTNKLSPGKIKIKLNRPLKSKIKKPIPITGGSRRKSKLKEKPIDDLVVEMSNYGDDDITPNYIHSEMSTVKSNFQDNNVYKKGESKFDSPAKDYKYDDDTNNDLSFKPNREEDGDHSDKGEDVADDEKPINNNNEEIPRSQKEKEAWANKSDSENSCSSFAKRGMGRGTPPLTNSTSVASTTAEVLINSSESSNSSSSSSSRSSIDDNEENENSSDNDGPEKIKACPNNSQTQNQTQNSPTPLQSINSQQCPTPHREVPSPSPIQKPIRHKAAAGVNPSPGVIIQQPRNPLPAPVFSTSLNLNSFNKKRTKIIGNSVVDSLNLHLPPGNATSGATTTVATASSLATRRPTIISAAGLTGGIYSNSPSLSPSGRTPGILHPTRKAHPHILSTSKAHRNFIPNSNSNNSSVNTNSVSISSPSQINTVTSISNCISSGTNSVQVQPNQNFSSSTAATISAVSSLQQSTNSSTASVQSFSTSSGNTLSVANAIPIGPVGVARTQGANIIFLQKAGSSSATSNTSANVMPVKNPRAVILRRAQLPCQGNLGNVMILDVQKNQLVNASQAPQFLQTARILSATTTDLSSLNLPGNQTARKIIQLPPSVGSSTPPTTVTYPAATNIGAESPFRQPGLQTQINLQTPVVRKARIFPPQSVVVTSTASQILPNFSTAVRTTVNVESSNPSAPASNSPVIMPSTTRIVLPRKEPSLKIQPLVELNATTNKVGKKVACPIEAELMEMERNDFYEEEVVTSSSDTNSSSNTESAFPQGEISKSVSTYGLSNCTNKVAGTTNYQSLKSNSALDTSLRINCSVTNTSVTPMSTQSRSANIEGGSSTDTASENESSFTSIFSSAESQNAKQKPVVEISELYKANPLMSSHVSVISSSNSSNSATSAFVSDNVSVPFHAVEESIETTPIPEDIFEAALKSSGLNFHDNSFFDNDDISTNPILNDMDSHQDHEIASQVEVITISDSNSTE